MLQFSASPVNAPFGNTSITSSELPAAHAAPLQLPAAMPSACQLRCPQCQYLIYLLASMSPPPAPVVDVGGGRCTSHPPLVGLMSNDEQRCSVRGGISGTSSPTTDAAAETFGVPPLPASRLTGTVSESDDASQVGVSAPLPTTVSLVRIPSPLPARGATATRVLSATGRRDTASLSKGNNSGRAAGLLLRTTSDSTVGRRLSDASQPTSRTISGASAQTKRPTKQVRVCISPHDVRQDTTDDVNFQHEETAIADALQELHYASDSGSNPLWANSGGFPGLVGADDSLGGRPPSFPGNRSNARSTSGTRSKKRAARRKEEHAATASKARQDNSGDGDDDGIVEMDVEDDENDAGDMTDDVAFNELDHGLARRRSESFSVGAVALQAAKKIGCRPALDDGTVFVQFLDVLYVVASVYLCCFALFLLHAPSRPWLINTTTGTMVVVVQMFTVAWTVLRCFVRNRDSADSYVVNDTVCDTAKKYIGSVLFWLDLIVAIPVEWMVVPLLTDRQWTWWALHPGLTSNINTTTAAPADTAQGKWELTAAVFSYLMLRHFLRCGRLASFVASSNPIVSERSIFRFLFAGAISVTVVCACAVAFQAWEGPTLAPLIAATVEGLGSTNMNTTQTPALVDMDHAAITTPGLFASFDALYWSMTTSLGVGYGDITARTPGGRAIAILTMLAGTVLLSIMTAIATSYVANKDPVQQELEERMRKMTSMLEYFEVPWELQRDVIASFPAVMEAHSRAAFLDMIENLPEICRNRVEGYSRLRLLRRIHLFEGIEREHAFMLAKCLTQRFVAAQDLVVRQGDPGKEMYFVVQGMLDVLVQVSPATDEHIVVATIREGSFFGERGLLEGTSRAFTVMAITLTELLVLTRTDFQQIVASVPAILDMFKRNVFKKLNEEATRSLGRVQGSSRVPPKPVLDAARMPWLAAALQSSALPANGGESSAGLPSAEDAEPFAASEPEAPHVAA